MDLTHVGGDWMDHAQAVAWFDNVKKSNVVFCRGSVKTKHQPGSSAEENVLFYCICLFFG